MKFLILVGILALVVILAIAIICLAVCIEDRRYRRYLELEASVGHLTERESRQLERLYDYFHGDDRQ